MSKRTKRSSGGQISESVQGAVRFRVLNYAREHYAGKYWKIDVRFEGSRCFIDAYQEPAPGHEGVATLTGETPAEFRERVRNTPVHLVRLEYVEEDRWRLAFYTYSHERYEPCLYPNGEEFGTVEQAFEVGASAYLTD